MFEADGEEQEDDDDDDGIIILDTVKAERILILRPQFLSRLFVPKRLSFCGENVCVWLVIGRILMIERL